MIQKFVLPLLIIFSWFVSCSDSNISDSDIVHLTQKIYVVPEGFTGEPYNKTYSSEKFFIDIKERVRICVVYSINGNPLSTNESIKFYNTHKWYIEDNEINSHSVYYSFNKAGIYKIKFETIDHLGDTLISHADIYVGTPASISLQSPVDKYNLIDGENKNGIELSWNIYGIDSWENPTCFLYAHYDPDMVWGSSLGEMDCNIPVQLYGRLDYDIDSNNQVVDHKIDNATIYWGVQAYIKNEQGNIEKIRSKIFSFSTKIDNPDSAVVEIPVLCKYSQYPNSSHLKGMFISSTGDTLSIVHDSSGQTVIRQTLEAQSNIKFTICDTILKEYGCNSMTLNLAPRSKTITDTLFLLDKTKPSILPLKTKISTKSDLDFMMFDNGAGLNVSKIRALMDEDSLRPSIKGSTVSVPNTCKSACELTISGEDYASNKTPDIYWNIIVDKDTTLIKGPFTRFKEDD